MFVYRVACYILVAEHFAYVAHLKLTDKVRQLTNKLNSQNRLFSRGIPILAALMLAFLLSPLIAERFGFLLPTWFPFAQDRTGAVESTMGTAEEFSAGSDPLAETWPTVSGDILAASGNVTPSAPRATATVATTSTPFPTPTRRVLPTPAWRTMNRLTNVKFNASTIIEAERNKSLSVLGDITTDRLLLKAVGDISVGIDLSRISDVQIDGDSIRLTLPAPEVMAVELLPEQSEIYASSSSMFLSQYEGLESDALELARRQLRIESASNQGIMDLTSKMARLQLAEFLESIGYAKVIFETE